MLPALLQQFPLHGFALGDGLIALMSERSIFGFELFDAGAQQVNVGLLTAADVLQAIDLTLLPSII
jgi:hypothetical protein